MPEPRQAQNLREAFNAFDPTHPLRGAYYDAFYVERPVGVHRLIEDLRADERASTKWLFTGHRGSGKSTELIRLAGALQDRYFTVYFTVEDVLDMADVDYKDVILALGGQLYEKSKTQGVPLPRAMLKDLISWFSTTLKEVEGAVSAEADLEAKADFWFLKLLSKVKSESKTRQVVRRQFESNLSDLLTRVNEIVDAIAQKAGRPVLAVVDGLDKIWDLEKVKEIYYAGGINLLIPRCKAVYTVPLALFYTQEFGQVRVTFDGTFPLPNVKVKGRAGDPYEPGRIMLRDLIVRRMHPGLITDDARERLIELSGGVLRELVALARDACSNARARDHARIELGDVERAASQVRNLYRTMLTPKQLRALWQVHTSSIKQPADNTQAEGLVHNLSLLGYVNDESWWDVHPVVLPLLEERADEMARGTGG
jgi:energy-coupling factor transporter ATP-binding protein EcfA2